MEAVPAEEFSPLAQKERFFRGRREQVFVLVFVTIVTILVLVTVLFASYLQQANIQPAGGTIDQATWDISLVSPSNGSSTNVDLTLTSSIGNVRHYNGIRSYGLSNNRQKLVISNTNALTLVNLPDDAQAKLTPAFDYSGDEGQAISWTADDNYFALAVYKGQDTTDTHVVVYSATGEVFNDIKGTFASMQIEGNTIMFPVKFAPGRNLFIARVFKTDDKTYYASQSLTIDQLPIILRVYNLDGNTVKEMSVRDAATDGSQVVYFWDQAGTHLVYQVVPANQQVNYADDAAFTKVGV